MKKAKIMLTAITVLAVVGGALAFKAKTFSGFALYTSSDNGSCVFDTKFDPSAAGSKFINVTLTDIVSPVQPPTIDVQYCTSLVTTTGFAE